MTEIEGHQSMALFPENALFNKYELGKLLGRGAFAKVYHARNIATGQSVAIKVINKSRLKNSSNLMANIKREISIMSHLRHPNIVKLYEVLATTTKIYFVLEFVKGGELFAKVAKARFGEDLCRKIFRQLIFALSYCHSKGIYHRDLKPENLLLDEYGDLKVTDFGLSALSDHVKPDGLLHTICGTPAYVAPEILTKQGYDGAKIDVWSSGVVLFVLVAGYLPFNDANVINIYKKIYKGEYSCPKWISSDMKRFLSRLMDINPNTRITIDEIKHDPWFTKGYRNKQLRDNKHFDCINVKENYVKSSGDLNAFDIIAFSSGLDLSGLFECKYKPTEDMERITVEDSSKKVVEKMKVAVQAEKSSMRLRTKKDFAMYIEGENGKFIIALEVYRLTDNLVVVEAIKKAGDGNAFRELWKGKIRPALLRRSE